MNKLLEQMKNSDKYYLLAVGCTAYPKSDYDLEEILTNIKDCLRREGNPRHLTFFSIDGMQYTYATEDQMSIIGNTNLSQLYNLYLVEVK